MKGIVFSIFVLLIAATVSFSQGDGIGFSYQAVAVDRSQSQGFGRDPGGKILAEHDLTIRFSIRGDMPEGPTVFQETHDTSTDIFGIFRCIIGQGERIMDADLTELHWGQTTYYLAVEVDMGAGFFLLGTEVLTIPPYASGGDGNNMDELQDISTDGTPGHMELSKGSQIQLNVDDNDADPRNEIQDISTDASPGQLAISDGSEIRLNVDDCDADSLNEIQDLALENGFLSITNNSTATEINLNSFLSGAFSTSNNITFNASGDLTSDSFLFGSAQFEDDASTEDDDVRLFFNKHNGAFRAGLGLNGWTDVGDYSTAFGYDNRALGEASTAFGVMNYAPGIASFVSGGLVEARGTSSAAFGIACISSGDYSFSTGLYAVAHGNGSLAIGEGAEAYSYTEASLGRLNTTYVPLGGTLGWDPADRLFVLGNGTYASRSDALIVYKSGNAELNGLLTLDPDNDNTGYTFPDADGINGQVLTTNGNGTLGWTNSVGNSVFVTSDSVTSNEIGNYAYDDFVFGSPSLDYIFSPDTDTHFRFFFDKSKGAFRAGWTTFNSWDDQYRGLFSTAFGTHTTASGDYSLATGNLTTASGDGSVVFGAFSEAFSYGETVVGLGSTDYEVFDPVNSISTFYPADRLFVIGNGNGIVNDPSVRSDALVMLKSGATRLHGHLTIDADNVPGPGEPYTLPGQDGEADQVMVTDGNGTLTWVDYNNPQSTIQDLSLTNNILTITNNPTATEIDLSPYLGGVFSTTSGVTSNANGDYGNDDFVFGSPQTDDDGVTTHLNRMFFDKSKAAFRAGHASNDEWDEGNRGFYSFAGGFRCTAGGTGSIAIGYESSATDNFAVALGRRSSALATATFAAGYETDALQAHAVAIGSNIIADGEQAIAVGTRLIAAGEGARCFGSGSISSGDRSTTMGTGLRANAFGETVLGIFNTDTPPSVNGDVQFNPQDNLFVIGNGTGHNDRSDAFRILKNGDAVHFGKVTIDADNEGGNGGYTLPEQDAPVIGYVMMSDNNGTVSWVDPATFLSDKRLKTDIKSLEGSLEKLNVLNPVHFHWNGVYNNDPDPLQTGFIAQEVQTVLPELVTQDEESDYLRVNYIGMIPHLVEAVKALKQENDELKKGLLALKKLLEEQ